jgi:DNA replication licensing factor MCM2
LTARRKYLRVATDHEEVLAFLLGQLVKDKARYHTLRDGVSPASVDIKISEFEERVRSLQAFFQLEIIY